MLVRDTVTNAFWRELLEYLIEAHNEIDTSLVRNQLMMSVWLSNGAGNTILSKIDKIGKSYFRDTLSLYGYILGQTELQQKWKLDMNSLYYRTVVINIKKIYKETTLYPF